jgi:Zn finger protein HypA/HybF involved in hydrogenase expression
VIAGAKLIISTIKGTLKCSDCGFEGESQSIPDLPDQIAMFAPMKCPKCEGSATTITGGKEFIITNIEAEIPGVP